MEKAEAIGRLKAHEAELKQLGVKRLYMFGSTARNAATEVSDVDLFFDYKDGKFGLYELMDVQQAATRILGCKADVITRDSLHHMLRATIESSAQRIF